MKTHINFVMKEDVMIYLININLVKIKMFVKKLYKMQIQQD